MCGWITNLMVVVDTQLYSIVCLLHQGRIEGSRIQTQVLRGWSTRRGKWPSPRAKCIRNEEYDKGEERRGEWQSKVASVILEMEQKARRGIEGVVQIDPLKNESEELAGASPMTGTELRALALALLSEVFQCAKLYGNH
jgi:hypothetical protein